MKTTSRRRLTAFCLAGALLAGACSSGGGASEEEAAEDPQQAFSEALDAFADYEGVTIEATVDADAEDLVETDTPPEVAEAILNSSLVLSGKGSTPEDIQFEMRVNVDGNEDAVALRVVGSSLYVRTEVRELVEAFGGDMASIDQAVQQASAMGFDFAQAAVDGEWIGVEGIDQLAEQFGFPVATPDPEQAAELQEKFAQILESNASVTSEGTDDVGAHLRVNLPLRDVASDLVEALQTLGGAPPLPPETLQDVPDTEIPIDVWVSDGRLVQIEADFIAIGEALGEEPPADTDRLAFRMTIDEFTDEIAAPDDFVAIDVAEILQGVLGAGGMGSGAVPPVGAGGGGDREVVVPELGLACSDLAGVPPAQIETFLEASGQPGALKKVRKACPELF